MKRQKRSFKPLKITSKIGNKKRTYFIIKRSVKYPRLEFKKNSLYLVVPKETKDFKEIIKKKEKWIIKKQELIDKFLKKSENITNKFLVFGVPVDPTYLNSSFLKETKSSKNALKLILLKKIKSIAEEYSKKLGIRYNKIIIRNQTTKWASCSSKRNLSFNIKALSLPEPLINYLVFHEMIHLIEKKHNERFISLIKREFPNYRKMEEELTKYWFALNNNHWWNNF